jgi:hypothetical protein
MGSRWGRSFQLGDSLPHREHSGQLCSHPGTGARTDGYWWLSGRWPSLERSSIGGFRGSQSQSAECTTERDTSEPDKRRQRDATDAELAPPDMQQPAEPLSLGRPLMPSIRSGHCISTNRSEGSQTRFSYRTEELRGEMNMNVKQLSQTIRKIQNHPAGAV